jgi:hypothetical protein
MKGVRVEYQKSKPLKGYLLRITEQEEELRINIPHVRVGRIKLAVSSFPAFYTHATGANLHLRGCGDTPRYDFNVMRIPEKYWKDSKAALLVLNQLCSNNTLAWEDISEKVSGLVPGID